MNTQAQEIEKKDKRTGWMISIGVHLVIFALCYFLAAYVISIPAPGDLFVEVAMADYGTTSTGGGDTESEVPSETVEEVVEEQVSQATQPVQTSDTKPIVTQDNSSVSTPTSSKPSNTTQEVKDPEPQVSNELNNVLNQINNSGGGGGSDGSTTGVGNEGNTEGAIEGKGVVGGKDGIGWELTGRGMVGEPTLNEKPTEEGKVVLDIYVDRQGKVISTSRNYAQSNTSSSYLFELAEKAAKTARFNVKDNAATSQKGKMTFNFKLR
jgi:periplasmic protein TonB